MARVKKGTEKKRAEYFEAQDLHDMAVELKNTQDAVRHIDPNEIIFVKEMETQPKAAARCYSLVGHPIQFFTDARFCIVFYESNIDYFTPDQRAILLLHELMHIPETGDKLVDHDIKDFRDILQLGVDWNMPGAKVPKLIKGEGNGKAKDGKKVNKKGK